MTKNNVWFLNELCTLKEDRTSKGSVPDIINVKGLYYDVVTRVYRILGNPTGKVSISDVIFNINSEIENSAKVDLLSGYTLTNVKFIGTICKSCSNIEFLRAEDTEYTLTVGKDLRSSGPSPIDTTAFQTRNITLGDNYTMTL